MILIGSITKRLLNIKKQIIKTEIAAIAWDRLDVAQLLILSDVLTNTAVTGSPPMIQDQILAIAFHSISLSLENHFFVIFSAAFHEMIVSKTVIIATTSDVLMTAKKSWELVNNCLNEVIYDQSRSAKFNDGYLSISNGMSGNIPCLIKNPSPIPTRETTIAPGIFGVFFLSMRIIAIPIKAVINGAHCICVICKNISWMLR